MSRYNKTAFNALLVYSIFPEELEKSIILIYSIEELKEIASLIGF
jgi:hypothetical protein